MFRISSRFSCSLFSAFQGRRTLSATSTLESGGVVLGVYNDGSLTKAAQKFQRNLRSNLSAAFSVSKMKGKPGEALVLIDTDKKERKFPRRIALVGLGSKDNCLHDDVRVAMSAGVKALKKVGATEMILDPSDLSSSAPVAEGSILGLDEAGKWKKEKEDEKEVSLSLFVDHLREKKREIAINGWEKGRVLADAQLFARFLTESPANLLTPFDFANTVNEKLSNINGISVSVHDLDWIRQQEMGGVIGVSQGSEQKPKFLEINFKNCEDENPLVLVGKGVTFDSGGISLKPSANMGMMKGDMGGAGVVSSVIFGIGQLYEKKCLSFPINLKVLIPLVENMPSGSSIRPGDVLTMKNKMTVEVDNTDAEGRLILADGLTYGQSFNPSLIIDVATLTGAMDVALGDQFTGVFSSQTKPWEMLEKAGEKTGEKMWRMPLSSGYLPLMKSSVADICNAGSKRSAGSCTAAIFLKEFVADEFPWMHLDIAGVMHSDGNGYHPRGMTGVPTRALIQFVEDWANLNQKKE